MRVYGALNPEATYPFDPSLLPDVPFCSFRQWPVSSTLEFSWSISKEEDEERTRLGAEKRLRAAGFGELVDEVRRRTAGGSSGSG